VSEGCRALNFNPDRGIRPKLGKKKGPRLCRKKKDRGIGQQATENHWRDKKKHGLREGFENMSGRLAKKKVKKGWTT